MHVQLAQLRLVVTTFGDKGQVGGRKALGQLLFTGKALGFLGAASLSFRLLLLEHLLARVARLAILLVGGMRHHKRGVLVIDAALEEIAFLEHLPCSLHGLLGSDASAWQGR